MSRHRLRYVQHACVPTASLSNGYFYLHILIRPQRADYTGIGETAAALPTPQEPTSRKRKQDTTTAESMLSPQPLLKKSNRGTQISTVSSSKNQRMPNLADPSAWPSLHPPPESLQMQPFPLSAAGKDQSLSSHTSLALESLTTKPCSEVSMQLDDNNQPSLPVAEVRYSRGTKCRGNDNRASVPASLSTSNGVTLPTLDASPARPSS